MRILLDECVPWPMHRILFDTNAPRRKNAVGVSIKNGGLLRLAEEFDFFVTSDQNIRYQQEP